MLVHGGNFRAESHRTIFFMWWHMYEMQILVRFGAIMVKFSHFSIFCSKYQPYVGYFCFSEDTYISLKLIKVFVIHAIFRTITLWSLKHLLRTINLLWKKLWVFGTKISQQNISKSESLSVCFASWPRLTFDDPFIKLLRKCSVKSRLWKSSCRVGAIKVKWVGNNL